MAIITYGDLKNTLSTYMFHSRFVAQYDNATLDFEAMANRRLRVLPMETSTTLTTVDGDVAVPDDYLAWRTVLYTGYDPDIELEYVHPAYLTSTTASDAGSNPQIFTIEGSTFKARPLNDTDDIYEFHYYQKIPTITGDDLNRNWLLTAHPDFYKWGVLTEMFGLSRNVEGAQLYKARRDEVMLEIIRLYALTSDASSPQVRQAEYF